MPLWGWLTIAANGVTLGFAVAIVRKQRETYRLMMVIRGRQIREANPNA